MIPLVKRLHPQGIPWPFSRIYNRLSQTRIFRDHYRLVAEEVARTAGPDPGAGILDIGTGPGFLLHELARCLPGTPITGVDISPAMADQARKNLTGAGLQQEIGLCCADAASLPFRDGAFAWVVSTGAIHHWSTPRTALEEIYRVLVPGGSAWIYDLVRRPPRRVRRKIQQEFGSFRMALLWLHSFEEPFMTPDEMTALAAPTRFKIHDICFTGGLCRLAMTKSE